MTQVPEGVQTVTAEGSDLRAAVTAAAALLGVTARDVEHKLDLSHFRSASGSALARNTVKVIAWAKTGAAEAPAAAAASAPAPAPTDAVADDAPAAEAAPERPRRERREREDRPPREERAPREDRPPREDRAPREDRPPREERAPRAAESDAGGTSEVSAVAERWFAELTRQMGMNTTVSATGDASRIRIKVKADAPGRLVGRRGTTLGAIRHLLSLVLAQYGEPVIDVDVDGDGTQPEEPRSDRSPRDARPYDGDRPPRSDDRRADDRPPRRDDRRDDRPPRRDDRRDDRPRRDDRRDDRRGDDRRERQSPYTEAQLQEIARRAAAKSIETGKPITINVALNSYDRRIVHMEVSGLDGVISQSVVKDDVKYVQVVPSAD